MIARYLFDWIIEYGLCKKDICIVDRDFSKYYF